MFSKRTVQTRIVTIDFFISLLLHLSVILIFFLPRHASIVKQRQGNLLPRSAPGVEADGSGQAAPSDLAATNRERLSHQNIITATAVDKTLVAERYQQIQAKARAEKEAAAKQRKDAAQQLTALRQARAKEEAQLKKAAEARTATEAAQKKLETQRKQAQVAAEQALKETAQLQKKRHEEAEKFKTEHALRQLDRELEGLSGQALSNQPTSPTAQQKTADIKAQLDYINTIQKTIEQHLFQDSQMKGKKCEIQIQINREGKIEKATILGGDPYLAEAALRAIRLVGKVPAPANEALFQQFQAPILQFQF